MAAFTVTASQLRSTAEELENLNSQFKNQVDNLETQEGSLASMWEGDAKDAFHKAFGNDKRQMGEFSDLIARYCQTLIDIATKYEQAEQQNLSTAQTRTYR